MALPLTIYREPSFSEARLVMGFSGWMDGGEVSTGTVEYLVSRFQTVEFAQIQPQDFFVYNVPGPMEVAALFRPQARIENGVVAAVEEPANAFHGCPEHNLILFAGREPNVRWKAYADCILHVAATFGVTKIYFVGSVAGIAPHTRMPRFFCSVSEPSMTPLLQQYGLEPSNYAGPAGFVTYLTTRCPQYGIEMMNVVAEVPAYVQGRNVKCIEATIHKLGELLDISIHTDDLHFMSVEFEKQLSKIIRKRPELAELIGKIEHDYDRQVVDTQMADLKAWFEKQDIRLD
ncbi:MAG TPA: PAC2 family protein [Candidatus Hydrogenedentes bacterium]|nr:PAC2 family protein [Candidatus Hydrogenedentota bacterium]HNT89522.1 PAC2 family protein [Candidatus Hydrogenedentota bacterium]